MKKLKFKIEDLKIREAYPSDFEEIARILFCIAEMHHQGAPELFKKPVINDPAIKNDFLNIIKDKKNAYFVAILKNEVVGLVSISIKERRRAEHIVPGRFAYIMELGVGRKLQGHGIGKTLVDRALEWIKLQRDVQEVALNVRSFNKDAIEFYKNLGFETVSYRMSKGIENE